MDVHRVCRGLVYLTLLPLIVCGCDCVHRRQSVYPKGLGRRVQIQAGRGDRALPPFVDIPVPEKPLESPVMLGD